MNTNHATQDPAPSAGQSKAAQHTPGPWKVAGSSIIGPPERNGDQPHAADADCVAIVLNRERGSYRHYPPARAAYNARLLAAAPELLAALEECITHDGATAERSHAKACQRLHAISEIARAAIAKAKGVQP